MKIVKLTDGIYRIENFLGSKKKFSEILEFMKGLDYKLLGNGGFFYKRVIFNEKINIYVSNYFFSIAEKELYILKIFFEKITGKNYILNKMGSFIKLQKGDSIGKHKDQYTDLQCVMHLHTGTDTEGGKLIIYKSEKDMKGFSVSPKKNSVVIFFGKLNHIVSEYKKSDYNRYSISFGFSFLEKAEINLKLFNLKIDKMGVASQLKDI